MTAQLKGEGDLKNMTFAEKVKFYTSLCLGTTALLSVFAFLFLIPFVVDPSITTILANFDATPVACTTVEHIYAEGLSNCTWSSCREGCTSATPRCNQLYINYSLMPYDKYMEDKLNIADIEWSAGPIKFFVNTEGCGYPPRINCTEFVKQFGRDRSKEIFPCYYSKRYPQDRCVAQFDWNETLKNLVLAIGVPNLLFGISIGILSYWYCWPSSTGNHRPNESNTTTYATFESDDTSSANSRYSTSKGENHKEKDKDKKVRMVYANEGTDRERNALLESKPSKTRTHKRVNFDDDKCDNLDSKRRSNRNTNITTHVFNNKRYRLF